jgi:hypothetical protein
VLWDEVDEVLPSVHPRIAVVRPRGKPLKDMDAFVRQLEQLAVQGLIGPLLAKVQEVIPSYSGHVSADQPRVLQLNPEPRKPLAAAPANGVTARPTGRPPVEQGA